MKMKTYTYHVNTMDRVNCNRVFAFRKIFFVKNSVDVVWIVRVGLWAAVA